MDGEAGLFVQRGLRSKKGSGRYSNCTGCGAEYPLAEFIHLMDEAMEEQLAGLRCDRV